MSAAVVARALRGHRSGDGWLCRCPVPGHGKGKGDRNPSLLVKDGDKPGRLLVTCFGGCDAIQVLDLLRRRGFVDDEIRSRADVHYPPHATVSPPAPPPHEPSAEALALWRSAVPIAGTVGERYLLEHRGLGLGPDWPPTLRFRPEAVHPRKPGSRLAALLAAVQSSAGRVVALQATYLESDGRKVALTPPRWTFGDLGEGAVRLGPPSDGMLGLAEGTEDALAAMKLTGVTCWASLGAGRMARVALPTSVRELHVFADDDEAGRAATARLVEHHVCLGRRVHVRLPPEGFKDWAEVAAERAPA